MAGTAAAMGMEKAADVAGPGKLEGSVVESGKGDSATAELGKRGDAAAGPGKRVGIIGLDTSHSTAFTEALNAPTPDAAYNGYRIVAAYPWGSKDIQSSTERIPAYTEQVKKLGVEIVDSIQELLKKVDVVLLETNDGRPHLEQALLVMKAGKTLFIDTESREEGRISACPRAAR